MPQFDGTGPRGDGMFTGRGEGHCALRLPEPDSGEPAVGYAGVQGQPVRIGTDLQQPLASAEARAQTCLPNKFLTQGRRYRCGRRRCKTYREIVGWAHVSMA
jgi:hypothetical protein